MAQGDDVMGNGSPEGSDALFLGSSVLEFNRRETPTQSVADAIQQAKSKEIWGLPARGSSIASVKAYREARLPLGNRRGIMFNTAILPTQGSGSLFEARWYDGTIGVIQKPNGYVAIAITAFVNLQP